MDRVLVDRIARSVLYEGYMLYPYRRSALKNARRWTFGTLYPRSWTAGQRGSDRSYFQTEFLFAGPPITCVSIVGRFLAEDVETEVVIDTTIEEASRRSFADGELTFASTPLDGNTHKLTVILSNTSDVATLASAHAVISVSEGELISVTDPPPAFAAASSHCVNEGVWPVLIGPPGAHDTILASPIILPDYPEVAPESAGDLCDATEIEEILTLRILTLTDEEKAEVRASGERARRILEQAEMLPAEHLMKLHGVAQALGPVGQAPAPSGSEPWSAWDNWANAAVVQTIRVNGAELKPGDRVRLRPAKRADIFDMALEGRAAIITAIEQDFENKVHVVVVIEDDPGRDLGEMRQTAHRFFFSPEEIELP
jgi:hypothetical protein